MYSRGRLECNYMHTHTYASGEAVSHSGLIPGVKRLNEVLLCVEAMPHISRLGVAALTVEGKLNMH